MNERERSLASVVASSLTGSIRLETYPRTEIDISVLVLDDNGGVLSASIVAGSLALVREKKKEKNSCVGIYHQRNVFF